MWKSTFYYEIIASSHKKVDCPHENVYRPHKNKKVKVKVLNLKKNRKSHKKHTILIFQVLRLSLEVL